MNGPASPSMHTRTKKYPHWNGSNSLYGDRLITVRACNKKVVRELGLAVMKNQTGNGQWKWQEGEEGRNNSCSVQVMKWIHSAPKAILFRNYLFHPSSLLHLLIFKLPAEKLRTSIANTLDMYLQMSKIFTLICFNQSDWFPEDIAHWVLEVSMLE